MNLHSSAIAFCDSKTLGDSNEAKIRVAEYSTILFQQGRFLSRVRPTKFEANIIDRGAQ